MDAGVDTDPVEVPMIVVNKTKLRPHIPVR